MKLNGGDFLLDLTGITLVSDTSTTISDVSIIKQLTGLKTYINNQKAIKPIYVKVIDDGEVVVARGETRKTISELTFELFVKFKSKSITINVEFTQLLDDDNNPLDDYYIASGDASYVYIANSDDPNNVKPIYYHPIYVVAGNMYLTFALLNNRAEPYTWLECLAELKRLMDLGALIQCNGLYKGAQYCQPLFIMRKNANNYYVVLGTTSGLNNIDEIVSIGSIEIPTLFEDGVNKIN